MDTEDLSRFLNAHRVEFVIIGDTAFPIHGYARATLDIDIFIRPNPKMLVNCWRLSEILAMTSPTLPWRIF
jgi:predicted nucleotidyltransferase